MNPITLTLKGRPRSTKNSRKIIRVNGKPRSVMSDSAAAWITSARASLKKQWKGRPLQHAIHLHVHAVFCDRHSLPDPDNCMNAVLDALKSIVLRDDNLTWVPSFAFSHEVTPGAKECLVLTLSEAV
ncbi:RusA family crossover junction endodeoxyribonuclease [Deinococcus hopiensis]|uniref:Holliday junction resolvase RusA (Prophage-encoded endonuclease) n=1 Tax=Deinococcus hopiensis KR-140 TaxID=695939 RepID=A0A1W1UXL2_9DEIO|nr:RusA family crossover junction endodeoxyribonuclease [Deinococcus hopiensis]SMB85845.1 Holliday junction resolvase RusA (prophage-encoded endonuclease) [Deinococcus hopiensis KR-140]